MKKLSAILMLAVTLMAVSLISVSAEESAAFESLLQEAQRWHQLQILDKYLDALRQEVPRNAAFEQWLQWARHRRRLFDPIKQRIADQGSKEI